MAAEIARRISGLASTIYHQGIPAQLVRKNGTFMKRKLTGAKTRSLATLIT